MLELAFILYCILMIFAGGCFLRLYHTAIQSGEILDKLFGWQVMLNKLYNKGGWFDYLGKALGDCQTCFAFWFMPIWYTVYIILGKQLGIWILSGVFQHIMWYLLFHVIGAVIGLIFITYKKKD